MDFVATKKSWYYYMSSECKTQLSNSGGGFYCPKCDITTQEPIPRYKIPKRNKLKLKMMVDQQFSPYLVKKHKSSLVNHAARYIILKDEMTRPHIPALIKNLIGTTYVFQVKATQYNKKAKRQTFSVSQIHPQDILDNKEDKGKENGVTQEKSSETKGVVAKRNKSMIIDMEEETLPNKNQNSEATIIKRAKLK
ncbi:hypothetical protein Cgig2_026674 [Carnegiea gigantea]|uniref:Uncharacterized protein n=1 Tax=Carnegiea gigantea TaxID=171969 RepID=A0A9Q1QA19_9CARY|nr:hypothetical protein Cgig2_026674 [Carnegiea gigantea]